MTIKKLAVEPIHPAAIPAAVSASAPGVVSRTPGVVPMNWQSAFALLARQMAAAVDHQVGLVNKLTAELADARGLIVAGDRARADLGGQLAAVKEQVAAVAESAEKHTNDTVAAAIDKLTTAGDKLDEALGKRIDAVDNRAGEIAARVEGVAEMIGTAGERIDAVEKQSAGNAAALDVQDKAVKAQGEKVAETERGLCDLRSDVQTVNKSLAVAAKAQGDLFERLDDVAGKVEAVTKGQDGFREAVAGVQKYAGDCFNTAMEAITGEAESQAKAVAEVVAAVERLDQGTQTALKVTSDALGEITETVGAVAEDGQKIRAEVVKMIVDRAGEIDERITDCGGRIDALVKGRAEDHAAVERLDSVITVEAALLKATGDKLTEAVKTQGEQALRLTTVEDVAAGAGAAAALATGEISKLHQAVAGQVDTIRATGEQATDALRRVTMALDQLPTGMMLDRDGELVRVTRSGEMTALGKVIGRDGRDGRDGAAAAEIVAVRIDDDRFIMTLSDRTEIGCGITGLINKLNDPVPAAPEIDPTTLGYLSKDAKTRAVQIEDMIKLRAVNWTFAKIGRKYKCSARTVARLTKGLDDDDEGSNA